MALDYIVAATDPFSRLFSAVSKFDYLQTKRRVTKMEIATKSRRKFKFSKNVGNFFPIKIQF